MKTIEEVLATFGRFAVGLAIGIALTSAYVIATEAGSEGQPSAGAMAADSLRATGADTGGEAGGSAPPDRLHVYGRGAQRV